MCRLTLAWVTSENSTKQLECRHLLTRSSSLDPILSPTVSGVDHICPWFHANSSAGSPLCCPVANCLSAPLSSQLSFASPYHFRIRRDFRSENPLSGFAPKQTKESSARATHIVLHLASLLVWKPINSHLVNCKFYTVPGRPIESGENAAPDFPPFITG